MSSDSQSKERSWALQLASVKAALDSTLASPRAEDSSHPIPALQQQVKHAPEIGHGIELPVEVVPLTALTPQVQFSEQSQPWQPIPRWVQFSVKLGFELAAKQVENRRICFVSMPCDSAGAGLVALGAIRKRLELKDANDLGLHFQRIRKLGSSRLRPTLLRHKFHRGRFVFDSLGTNLVWLKQVPSESNSRMAVFPHSAEDWHFDGEAPVRLFAGARLPFEHTYENLLPGVNHIFGPNLAVADSGVCLAGRVAGANSSAAACSNIRFEMAGESSTLAQLLTVQGWSNGTTSRASFFNTRTETLDRETGRPRTVIADGAASFLRIAERAEFSESDVIVIVDRTSDRDILDEVGIKIANLRQWYAPDEDFASSLAVRPRGIDMLTMKRT